MDLFSGAGGLLGTAMLVGLAGCGWFGQTEAPVSRLFSDMAVPEARPSGAAIYAQNCGVCHGPGGKGDGALGGDLPVRPADLTTLAARNGGTFPAQRVMEVIHGYPGKFHRGSMPEFGEVLKGPVTEWRAADGEIIMTPVGLMEIVAHVEGLQG